MALTLPTSAQVLSIREQKQIGMFAAKREAMKLALVEAVEQAQDMNDIKEILKVIVNDW